MRNHHENIRREFGHSTQPLVRSLAVALPGLVGRGDLTFYAADVLDRCSHRILAPLCVCPQHGLPSTEDVATTIISCWHCPR